MSDKAPNFTMCTLDREVLRLADLKGRVVLLDFWGTWCAPCRAAIPELKRLVARLPAERFVLIGVCADEGERAVREFVRRNKIEWPQYREEIGGPVQRAYGIDAYPTYVVIDPEGSIRARAEGRIPFPAILKLIL